MTKEKPLAAKDSSMDLGAKQCQTPRSSNKDWCKKRKLDT